MGSYNPLSSNTVQQAREMYERIGLCYECGTPKENCKHAAEYQQREIDQIKDWLFADWEVEAEALAADARDEMATQEDALQIGLR